MNTSFISAAVLAVLSVALLAGCNSEPLCQPEKCIHNYPDTWMPCNNGVVFSNGDTPFFYEYRECWSCGKWEINEIEIGIVSTQRSGADPNNEEAK